MGRPGIRAALSAASASAHWPAPPLAVDQSVLDSAVYMRGAIKTMRDAELSLLKKMNKGKQGQATYDPKRPRAVRIYVTTAFPEWQEQCVQAVRDAYAPEHDKVDDQKVRELLAQRGLIKDKRAMPFVQAFKVSRPAFLARAGCMGAC